MFSIFFWNKINKKYKNITFIKKYTNLMRVKFIKSFTDITLRSLKIMPFPSNSGFVGKKYRSNIENIINIDKFIMSNFR